MPRLIAIAVSALIGGTLVGGCAEPGPGVAPADPGEPATVAPASKLKGHVEGPLQVRKIGE